MIAQPSSAALMRTSRSAGTEEIQSFSHCVCRFCRFPPHQLTDTGEIVARGEGGLHEAGILARDRADGRAARQHLVRATVTNFPEFTAILHCVRCGRRLSLHHALTG